jgi:uncharacterized protein
VAFSGLRHFIHSAGAAQAGAASGAVEKGLVPDPARILDLPRGFAYHMFSATGERIWTMGFSCPAHDGMCAFPGPNGKTILVRNHELDPGQTDFSPFGAGNYLFTRIDPGKLYDGGRGRRPGLAGTTTLVYDTRLRRLEKHFLSLAGTRRNCAGGPTPWNSWITCEETVVTAGGDNEKDHGYNFDVPASDRMELVEPVALKAMGRFNHEAVAVDPRTGIVYQTEDRGDGLFYRFIPARPGQLAAGGRLQALRIREHSNARNHPGDHRPLAGIARPLDLKPKEPDLR